MRTRGGRLLSFGPRWCVVLAAAALIPSAAFGQANNNPFGLQDRAALLREDTGESIGLTRAGLRRAAADAELLINISGMLRAADLRDRIPRRVYLDLDPAFNQLWHAVEGLDVGLDGHTHHVTVGNCIGRSACDVPTCGRTWITTLQPVVLSEWRPCTGDATAPWTTVGNWRSG